MARLSETVYDREQAGFVSTLVHDEWLANIIAGHQEDYKSWHEFAAWVVLKTQLEQPNGTNT